MKFIPVVLLFLSASFVTAQDIPHTLDPGMFRPGYDIPAGVDHGTWDFDEWPGVDHRVVYTRDFMYGEPGEKIKIDYRLSVFDADDHTGYLHTPETLAGRFKDMRDILRNARKIVAIFAHPDDEVLLAGGLLATAADMGKDVRVVLVSNGADGSRGFEDDPDDALGGYNCAGIMANGEIRVATDLMGLEKPRIARRYGQALGVSIGILPVSFELDGENLVQIGEYMGLDFKRSFGPGSVMRAAIQRGIEELIRRERPDVIITHGTDGEYGNYLHETVSELVKNAVIGVRGDLSIRLFTGFPEYNYADRITHFLDLDENGGSAHRKKHEAFKRISYVFRTGNDYDKPWNPNDDLMDGTFVKDYGYTPTEGEPPRYEFFQLVDTAGR